MLCTKFGNILDYLEPDVDCQMPTHPQSQLFWSQQEIQAARADQISALDVLSMTIQAECNDVRNNAAAISSLPEEILAIIFEIGYGDLLVEKVQDRFEISVSHVSREWREVALRTPRIWTKIRRVQYQKNLDSIAAYFQRSKAVALDLQIEIGQGHIGSHDDIIPFCRLFSPHCGRCRRLSVTSSSERDMIEMLECISSVAVPFLQNISLSLQGRVSDIIKSCRQIFRGGAPSLASIRLHGLALHCCLPPLGSITNLHLHGVDYRLLTKIDGLRDALLTMTSLAHLVVEGEVVDDWTSDIIIELPRLQSLLIRAQNDQDIAPQILGLLKAISAPALEVLSLQNICDIDFEFEASIDPGALGQSKFPSLCSLTLRDVGLSRPHMSTIAQAFPNITHLTHSIHEIEEIVSLLTFLQDVDSHSGPRVKYWPHLHTLALPSATDDETASIHEFVAWRHSVGHPIQRLLLPLHVLSDTAVALERTDDLREFVQVEVYTDASSQHFPTWSPDEH